MVDSGIGNESKIILSLCDTTGTWSAPYREAGYTVIQVDIKDGLDVRLIEYPGKVHGILAAPPCTDFSVSGAQYWKAKDEDGRTVASLAVADACMRLVALCKPEWWVLENPVGRLKRWYGTPLWMFNPCDYGGYMQPSERTHDLAPYQDAYTKKTLLWGDFNPPEKKPVEPTGGNQWIMKLGGKSAKTKHYRSVTPTGFARAFFLANP